MQTRQTVTRRTCKICNDPAARAQQRQFALADLQPPARRPVLLLIVLLLSHVVARGGAAPPSPASAPAAASQPVATEPLIDGSIRYAPPPAALGWKLISKADDRLKAVYATEDGHGALVINVTVEDRDVPDTMAAQMAVIIGKTIRADAKKAGRELLYGPRVEKDPRFFLVVHGRLRSADGESVTDRKQLYRVMGLNLVHVAVSATFPLRDNPQVPEAAAILTAGEELLAGMRLTRGAAPVVFPRTGIRMTTPVDWKLTKVDQPNGTTATYADPADANRQIIVRSRIVPKGATKDDPTKRDAVLERMVREDRAQPPLKAASPRAAGPAAAVAPAPAEEAGTGKGQYLKQVRTIGSRGEQKLIVETRYLAAGDVLLSIRFTATEGDETVGPVVDALASSITVIGH